MATRFQRIEFDGELLSASEIARRHGFSPPTILKRYALGFRGGELVAKRGSLTRAPEGMTPGYRCIRPPTPLEARYHAQRARRSVEMATDRLEHAHGMGSPRQTLLRLERAVTRAQQRRMYRDEMLRKADEVFEAAASRSDASRPDSVRRRRLVIV